MNKRSAPGEKKAAVLIWIGTAVFFILLVCAVTLEKNPPA